MTSSIECHDANQRLVIALGDPAGIGMEVTLKALADPRQPANMPTPLLVGCRASLQKAAANLRQHSQDPIADPDALNIEDLPVPGGPLEPGEAGARSGEAGFRWLTRAVELVQQQQGRALVTAPIAKHAWHDAGHRYPGQTERLAELDGQKAASMLFTAVSPFSGWRLNTLLATTHIPLGRVAEVLSADLVGRKLDELAEFCLRFNPTPQLLVVGLNPHSGEQGQLGGEEQQWLNPLLERWARERRDVQLKGPIPPDTCWLSAAKAWRNIDGQIGPDGILALYHDQGLIPVKLLAFDQAVNTTLGLSFLRTSPDHGTGFDIAGQGVARGASMLAAIQAAWELSQA
ncbi:MAG: 4-hydroxythreonine-4-phosphate dehydrogenase PdxA [Cyanobium sp. ARS6]|nr:4-hydroxythreonine-4-phosphate dehydrogenase PdxA [Cyanobium sp. ARS6]